MRQGEHQIVAFQYRATAPRDDAAERLDVLVEVVRPIDAGGQRIARVHFVIDFSEKLGRPDAIRHMSRLDREARAPENCRRRAEVLTQERDVVRVVDGDEVVRRNVEPLERQEVEGAIPLQRPSQRGSVLYLRVWSFLAIDRLPRGIEPLEMIL